MSGLVALLLKMPEIDVNLVDHEWANNDRTYPLHEAITTRGTEIVRLLLERPELNITMDSYQRTDGRAHKHSC